MSSEDQLIEQVRAGDKQALGEFIRLRTPQLLSFLAKRMADRLKQKVEPQDLLQELTVSCLNSVDTVDFGDRDPFSWLCQQAERRIIDAHRHHFGSQKREAGREVSMHNRAGEGESGELGDMLSASLTSASRAFSRKQKEFHVLAALEALPEDARQALRFRYLDGLPSKEIAERMGRTDGAVRVLLSRSLTKMQDLLAENEEFQTLRGILDPGPRDS